MTISGAFSLFMAVLKFVNFWSSWFQKRGHINEGRRLQIADELASIAKSAKAAGETRKAVEAMSKQEKHDVLTK